MCLLCQNPAARIELANSLHDYRWSDLVCRVIYQIVCSSPQISPEQLRSQLPTRLTNAGFPDFAWEGLFLPNTCSVQEAETLLRELQAPPSS
ncbi:MAG: hypothetical protein HY508_14555 [Acidobacteria bacterium]|nr:hypothetical protein [Acidobacteriota bacterium]